jgi:hypothetical protein
MATTHFNPRRATAIPQSQHLVAALLARIASWRYVGERRDLRFDLLRGLAVIAMVTDHVGGDKSWLYTLTGGNLLDLRLRGLRVHLRSGDGDCLSGSHRAAGSGHRAVESAEARGHFLRSHRPPNPHHRRPRLSLASPLGAAGNGGDPARFRHRRPDPAPRVLSDRCPPDVYPARLCRRRGDLSDQ